MRTLSRSAKGADVLFLQRMLNKRGETPPLAEDGDFGPKTHRATVGYQRRAGMSPANGTVNAATWNSFGRITEIDHRVTLFAQPTDMTCWSAAATMILGPMSVGQGGATTTASGGLDVNLPNIETFVRQQGWRMQINMSAPPPSAILSPLRRGPVWIAFQGAHFAHAVVFSGGWSDNSDDGTGTVFRVHDPWPPGRGTVYGTTYLSRQIILKSVPARLPAMIQYAAA